MKRSSGILMAVSSLPSPYGIGTMGSAAREFVDFLAAAGQTWWQMLPVGPTSAGDSPYQSPSAFAGNPYFIDLESLIADGLLTREEVESVPWGDDPAAVDYGRIYEGRFDVLHLAFTRGWERDREKIEAFRREHAGWLEEYSLFMALKRHFGMRSWLEWPDEAVRLRRPEALAAYRETLEEDIRFFVYMQYLFFSQWQELRAYAHRKGVRIMGDMALYMALDSADVWASPENFLLNEKRVPVEVAGVPPDLFSADGQLWGNPLYDYAYMKRDGFGWWIRRIGGADRLYDAIRMDHFRGLESYWAVHEGETTARNGRWVKGPGMDLVQVLKNWFPHIEFIAEDLGYPSPELRQFLQESGFPGMKVLELAFDSAEGEEFLPHTYTTNCVCYTGTHDNETILGWCRQAAPEIRSRADTYLGLNEKEGLVRGMLRGGMSSVADLFVMQMQDVLELGEEARMNVPGTTEGNWRWRMQPGQLTKELAERIAGLTSLYGRRQTNG